jgi:hypothetical protein
MDRERFALLGNGRRKMRLRFRLPGNLVDELWVSATRLQVFFDLYFVIYGKAQLLCFPSISEFPPHLLESLLGKSCARPTTKFYFSLMGDVVEPRREFIQDNSLNASVVVLLGWCLVG